MPLKDKAAQKIYQAAWFQKHYVPRTPQPKLSEEELRRRHREAEQATRDAWTPEERETVNARRRAQRRAKRVAKGLKISMTKDMRRINREHDERLANPFPVTAY